MAPFFGVLMAEIIAAIKSLGAIAGLLREAIDEMKQLRDENLERKLDVIRKEVDVTLKKITGARSNEEREKLALELNTRIGK